MLFPLTFLDIEHSVTRQLAKQQLSGSYMLADIVFRATGSKKKLNSIKIKVENSYSKE